MQSASSYDTTKVKEAVEQQVKEEQAQEVVPSNTNMDSVTSAPAAAPAPTPVTTNITESVVQDPVVIPAAVQVVPTSPAKAAKPRLRQQAYYLTEIEIKTIKRLSYELDIPKSDLVRKFIDEGIARIEQEHDHS